ncbi:undecaprenyl-diphosphatase [Jeotgalibacillus soli]|uniref:Bacitracin ABC transporter permease n=1 Tax=Jeotgalibacillus soli TaxID=889306 RepID=A0A0C2VW71_9BACL|nr:undecaprenyl-diphosphatase [Jeotgalibacillus soli]KIL48228.1 bacitracin ABC transporter permease [Jeotgalibacillus soli]
MDIKLFHFINGLAGRYSPLDSLMIMISNKIRYVFMAILGVRWLQNQAPKNVILSLLFPLFLNTFIRFFYNKPRPFMNHRVGILIPSKMNSSFPSKHVLLVFAVAASIFLKERRLGSVMLGLAGLTGLSRIWVGHHYPSDVLGSAVLGVFSGIMTNKFPHFFVPVFRMLRIPNVWFDIKLPNGAAL